MLGSPASYELEDIPLSSPDPVDRTEDVSLQDKCQG